MPNSPKPDAWKESLLHYFLSDLGMDLNATITLPRVFLRCAKHFSDKSALLEKKVGRYVSFSYADLLEQMRCFASALLEKGFRSGDRLAIFLKNSPDWVVSDFGAMFAGGITVPIYETLTPQAIRHILDHSGAVGIVVEDKKHFEKLREVWPSLPQLKIVLVRKAEGIPEDDAVGPLERFLEQGRESLDRNSGLLQERLEATRRDAVASVVYTSGTTGDPKGVMLTHRNLLSNIYGILSVTDVCPQDTMLSILPLSHVFERSVGYYVPLLSGATIAYAESIDAVSQNLQEVRPTICCAVPRLFEKIHARMIQNVEKSGAVKQALFRWALSVGRRFRDQQLRARGESVPDRRQRHRPEDRLASGGIPVSMPLRMAFRLADLLVYRKLRASMGGRLRFFVSGGAPLSKELVDFFLNLNISVYEGYGMTESGPVISFNFASKFRPGTVGKLLPYVQVKLSPESEIWVKGPNVMKGYFNNPEATREAIDSEGWLHTGDVGVFDRDNYLKITDRIKELLVMSNGKNVAPLPIENKLTKSPLVAYAMVVGNNRKYVSALLFPSRPDVEALAKTLGLAEASEEALLSQSALHEHFEKIVQEVNQDLPRYEQIKRFQVIPHELTIDSGEITPTLKLKRRVLDKKYAEKIDKMYVSAGED